MEHAITIISVENNVVHLETFKSFFLSRLFQKEITKKIEEEVNPQFLKRLVTMMQEYGKGSGYMVGDSVSKTTNGYKYMFVMMLHGQKTV